MFLGLDLPSNSVACSMNLNPLFLPFLSTSLFPPSSI